VSDLDALYQEIILDHYKHPRGEAIADEPCGADCAEVHHVNPTCGDEITLRVRLSEGEGGPVVADVTYDALGCSISQASASVLTELLIGKPLEQALAIQESFQALMQGKGNVEPDEEVLEDGIAFAGVAKFPARVKCALLSWMAWKDATARVVDSGKNSEDSMRESNR
jgi:nitrogen fixation protein NifU and related proteins